PSSRSRCARGSARSATAWPCSAAGPPSRISSTPSGGKPPFPRARGGRLRRRTRPSLSARTSSSRSARRRENRTDTGSHPGRQPAHAAPESYASDRALPALLSDLLVVPVLRGSQPAAGQYEDHVALVAVGLAYRRRRVKALQPIFHQGRKHRNVEQVEEDRK